MLVGFVSVAVAVPVLLPLLHFKELLEKQDLSLNSSPAPKVVLEQKTEDIAELVTSEGKITDVSDKPPVIPTEKPTSFDVTKKAELPPKAQPAISKAVQKIPKKIEIAKLVDVPEPAVIATSPVAEQTDIPVTEEEEEEKETGNQYIKIDFSGNRLPDMTETWRCVEDPNTGLVWEVKSGDGDLHDKHNLYSWHDPAKEGGVAGVADGGRCDGDVECDTHAFIQAINEENYCGYSNWRLPTREEMLSIVRIGGAGTAATIDSDYFPQALPSWYWTATSNENYPDYAWYLLFRNGIALSDVKVRPKHLRLVRSDSPAG